MSSDYERDYNRMVSEMDQAKQEVRRQIMVVMACGLENDFQRKLNKMISSPNHAVALAGSLAAVAYAEAVQSIADECQDNKGDD